MGEKLTEAEEKYLRKVIKDATKKLGAHRQILWEEARAAGRLYTIHYYRYYSHYTDEEMTLEDAVSFARGGDQEGYHSSVYIAGPDGKFYTSSGDEMTMHEPETEAELAAWTRYKDGKSGKRPEGFYWEWEPS